MTPERRRPHSRPRDEDYPTPSTTMRLAGSCDPARSLLRRFRIRPRSRRLSGDRLRAGILFELDPDRKAVAMKDRNLDEPERRHRSTRIGREQRREMPLDALLDR